MPGNTLYRLKCLGGDGARLSEISTKKKLSFRLLEANKIMSDLVPFLKLLVIRHYESIQTQDVESAIKEQMKKYKIGVEMPAFEKFVTGKWRPFEEVQERVFYRNIWVEGLQEKEHELGSFNIKRCRFNKGKYKITNDMLRKATVVDEPLKAFLAFLGFPSQIGDAMPVLMCGRGVPLKESLKSGENNTLIAGESREPAPTLVHFVAWARPPMVVKKSKTLAGRLAFAEQKHPHDDVRFTTKRMTFNEAKVQFDAGEAHTREQHIAQYSPATEPLAIPDGWLALKGDVVDWLFQRGALLTRNGVFAVESPSVPHPRVLDFFCAQRHRGQVRPRLQEQLASAVDRSQGW